MRSWRTAASTALLFALVVASVVWPSAATEGEVTGRAGSTTSRTSAHEVGDRRGAAAATAGILRVAYPEEPAAWLPAFHQDAAAWDLAALWGLPLYAYDDAGQLRPRLAAAATVVGPVTAPTAGWAVDLALRRGRWDDGSEVTARDVVATIQALPEASAWTAAALAPIVHVEAPAPDQVRVVFAEPSGRWANVLADVGPILSADVLAGEGLQAYRDGLPATSGPFRLASAEPGLRRRFAAHPDGPSGPPGLAEVVVLTVPSYETALGLLRDGEVDAVVGHLALEPEIRVTDRLTDMSVAAPFGRTVVSWRWENDPAGRDREAVHAALRLEAFAQGLLGTYGRVADRLVSGSQAEPPELDQVELTDLGEVVVVAPRSHEVTAFAARAARDAIERRGGTVRVVSDEPDRLHQFPIGDVHVVVRRLGPWPSLLALHAGGLTALTSTDAAVVAADLADLPTEASVSQALDALARRADELALVDVAVAHVWAPTVSNLRPSGWPGAGFWSAGRWGTTTP